MNETTVSGSIAAGPAVGLGTQRRVQEEDSDDGTKAPDAPKAKEFGLWKNSVLAGAEQRDKKKSKKSNKVAESKSKDRNEMDTPAVQSGLKKMADRHNGENWTIDQLAALGKKLSRPVKDVPSPIKSIRHKDGYTEFSGIDKEILRNKKPNTRKHPTNEKPKVDELDLEEGLKNKLAGAVLAGAAALGGGGHAQAAPTDTGSNASIVKSLVNPEARQRFLKQHSDTTAQLKDPKYDHNPDALAQHAAYPKEQHAEWIQNVRNAAEFQNPYQIIRAALNMAGLTPQEVLQNLPKGYKLPSTEPKSEPVRIPGDSGYKASVNEFKKYSRSINERDYGAGQRQLNLAEENISEEQLLAKELARKLDLFMKGLDHELGKKSSDRGIQSKTEPSTGAMRENKKSIGPDKNDPFEKGWRARYDDANPYEKGTKEHNEWQHGKDEREAQRNHYANQYDESVETGDEQVISQKQIANAWTQNKDKVKMFIKAVPVAIVPAQYLPKLIPPKTLAKVKQLAGQVDSTSYSDEYEGKGMYIFQMKDGQPDIYIGGPNVLQKYVKFTGQIPTETKPRSKIPSITLLDQLGLDASKFPLYIKKVPTPFISAAVLGVEGKQIETSWGNQTVEKGAWITQEENGHTYCCNPDAQGLPIGYIPVQGQQDVAEEGKGLWANIHAKQNRIKNGSGEHMRKPGSKGAPTKANFKSASKTESVEETTGDPKFDKMLKDMTGKKVVAKQQKADTKQQSRDAFSSMFGGGNPTDTLSIRKKGVDEAVEDHTKIKVDSISSKYPGTNISTGSSTVRVGRKGKAPIGTFPTFEIDGHRYITLADGNKIERALKQDVAETTGDKSFDEMMRRLAQGVRYKGAKADQQADAAYNDMMNNITKNAADVAKPSTNSKFEQVYSAVEKILLSSNVHWDIDDDISDALAKLKIKANDKLIQKLERELINRVSDALQFYDDSDLEEQIMTEATGYKSQFPSAAPAIQYAKDKVKTFRDSDDGIEIWSMPDGGCDVVHTSNSNGRNHCIANRGKKLGTIRPQKQVKETSNYGDLDEVAPPHEEKLVKKLKKEYPGHPEKAFATAWSIHNKKSGKK